MDELLKLALPALLALIGVFITGFIGYWQWKRQRDIEQGKKFREDRNLVYINLWNMIEETHIKLRSDAAGRREFDDDVTEVNSYLLKNSLYIPRADRQLASDYISAIRTLSKLIFESRDKRIKREWISTMQLHQSTLTEYDELQAAWRRADELRSLIENRFRGIISGQEK